MSENLEQTNELSDDQLLRHSQILRKQLVDKIAKDGPPTDKDEQYVLLTALKDMDKQIIDKKRVAIEDKNANVATIVAESVTRIASMFDNADPFKKQSSGIIPVADRSQIPEYTPVPGETEVGITSENYDDFMARNEKNPRSTGIESE